VWYHLFSKYSASYNKSSRLVVRFSGIEIGRYICVVVLREKIKDRIPLPLSQSKKNNMSCEENLKVK
jgi:hypothetical protein